MRALKDLPRLEWTQDLSRRFWNDIAGSRFQAEIAFARWASPELVRLVTPYLSSGGRVLDFGSGYGLFLVRELLRQGYRVAFFEPSVPEGEDRSDLAKDPNFMGSIQKVGDCVFDAAFCSEVIEHLDDAALNEVLSLLREALRPAGTLVVTTPDSEDLFLASRYCPTCRQLFHPWGHVRSFSATDLEALLAKHGFEVLALHCVDFSANREPLEELKRLKQSLSALLASCEEAAVVLGEPNPELAARLGENIERLAKYREQPPPTDPKRQHLGAGGTLVAIARKPETL